MKILKVRTIKRPYASCAYPKCEERASNEITLLDKYYQEVWLCDKHLTQLKNEVKGE